jgi:hypothetical protein
LPLATGSFIPQAPAAEKPVLNNNGRAAVAQPLPATRTQNDDITDNTIRDILHAETMRAAESALKGARQTIERSRELTSYADQILARR